MLKFKRRHRHSLPFGLFVAVIAALLLPAALAPRANANPTDYWNLEEPQGVLINQPFASNSNLTLASNNVASGAQPGAFQPLAVDANFSWTGATNSTWATSTNWSPAGPPGAADTAVFDGAFLNQPTLAVNATVGSLHMATGVAQNVSVSSTGDVLTINGVAGIGILVDNASGFNLTISTDVLLGGALDQAWTNNSGNLFTVTGAVNLNNNNLTVNGTGNTTISGIISSGGGGLIKDGSGTLIVTANNSYGAGTIVNGGTLLVNGTGDLGNQTVTVNSGGTLGGNSTAQITANVGLTVNAGGNLAPGNGGNNTALLNSGGALTLASTSNFLIDINGTTVGTGYDRFRTNAGAVTLTGSNLVVTVGTTLSVGQTFLILDKNAAGAITGTFAQGSTVVGSDGTVFSISYTGGNGNDVVLTVTSLVPEPSTYISGALAIAGLAFTQRRRLRKLIARRCAVGS
jgi:autotransporter-associated beta strand protein